MSKVGIGFYQTKNPATWPELGHSPLLLTTEMTTISHKTENCKNSHHNTLLTNLFGNPHLFMCQWKPFKLREYKSCRVNYLKCLSCRVTGMVNVGISEQTCQWVLRAFHGLHVLALYTALHWRLICYFYSNRMEKIFPPSPVAMEAGMLAVIHGHLFVLVCDESLKRVACPSWECLPFRHLYELNDPGARGRLFIGFPVFFFSLLFSQI